MISKHWPCICPHSRANMKSKYQDVLSQNIQKLYVEEIFPVRTGEASHGHRVRR